MFSFEIFASTTEDDAIEASIDHRPLDLTFVPLVRDLHLVSILPLGIRWYRIIAPKCQPPVEHPVQAMSPIDEKQALSRAQSPFLIRESDRSGIDADVDSHLCRHTLHQIL